MNDQAMILNTDSVTPVRSTRHRSPAWPFIPLGRAMERAREFYEAHRNSEAEVFAANVAWGMKPKSGAGFQTVATLKQYGLISETEKPGWVRLTGLALRIIQDRRDISPERDEALKQAALMPPIFKEIWEKWGADLPKDADIEFDLVNQKGFNEDAAQGLLANYKATIQVAKLVETDKVADKSVVLEDAIGSDFSKKEGRISSATLPRLSQVQLMEGERELTTGLLSKTASFRLIVRGEVGQKEIERLIAKLELDKEILADPGPDGGGQSE
jgi:hypothetical protein